jgi:hypothetical protein
MHNVTTAVWLELGQQICRYQQYANTPDKSVMYDALTAVTVNTTVCSD